MLAPNLPSVSRGRVRTPWRWVAALALLFCFGVVSSAGVVVYRIQTDKGELVIETGDDEVEVVVKQGGKVLTIYDPKTKQKLVLRSGNYELELNGKPTGLKLELEKATLKRGDVVIAKIQRQEPEVVEVGEVRRFPFGSAVTVYAVSPDGSLALLTESGGASDLLVWDLAKGKLVHRLKGHQTPILESSFSPDGKKIVSYSQWPDDKIQVWEVASGEPLSTFRHTNVYNAKFSADGRHLFSCGESDGVVHMWDLQTGQEAKRFVGHRGLVAQLIVSPDGRYLVTFGRGENTPDHTARVWEIETAEEVRQLEGLTEVVTNLSSALFLPDSRRIFVAFGSDSTAPGRRTESRMLASPRLYDVSTGKEIRRFENEVAGPDYSQSVRPDGRRVLMRGKGSFWLIDVDTGKELHRFDGHTDSVGRAVILPDGKFALTSSADKTMRLWRLPDPPAPAPKAEAVKDKDKR